MKPNGRDYTTDSVLARLVASDLATLTLARRLQARVPRTGGFQILDVFDDDEDEDDGDNQGHISDVSASQSEPDDAGTVRAVRTDAASPPTGEQQASTAPPDSGGTVVTVPPQGTAEVTTVEEGTTEGVEGDEETPEDAESLAAAAAPPAPPTRRADDDDSDSPPENKFKCTVPGCNQTFSEQHELKGMACHLGTGRPYSNCIPTAHIHEHDDKPYECELKGCDRKYSTQRERDRHTALHRLTVQFGILGFGTTTTTETAATTETEATTTDISGTQSYATQSLPSIIVSTTLPPGTDQPPTAPVVGGPPQA
jgi:hypothetical protein